MITIFICKKCNHAGFWSKNLKRFICFNYLRCDSKEYKQKGG